MIVILGPTASGKTNLAVKIANQFQGEIISADSRQIYKGMDIGTGKDLNEYKINNQFIKYHLIDIINPSIDYSVFQYMKDFKSAYHEIKSNQMLPILCGGTGLYLESILLDYNIPEAKPNIVLRNELQSLSLDELILKLKNIDMKQYDPRYHISKRRLIRSIEILIDTTSKKSLKMNIHSQNNFDNILVIGIKIDRSDTLKLIHKRLLERLNDGMIDEVKKLVKIGLPINRLHYFGLEYRFIGKYLKGEIDYDSMVMQLNTAINRFSKRQMTFFRRMEKRGIPIQWFKKDDSQLFTEIEKFLKK